MTYTPPSPGGQLGVVPQLGIARGRVFHARVRESLVIAAVHVLEEMRDDGRGQHVHALRARIVAHEDARELAVLDDRRGEATLAIL